MTHADKARISCHFREMNNLLLLDIDLVAIRSRISDSVCPTIMLLKGSVNAIRTRMVCSQGGILHPSRHLEIGKLPIVVCLG